MVIKKVIVPVAGWGTRSLPATKNIPKEMLPIFKKPVVQHVVEEAMASGLTDVVFINNQIKKLLKIILTTISPLRTCLSVVARLRFLLR